MLPSCSASRPSTRTTSRPRGSLGFIDRSDLRRSLRFGLTSAEQSSDWKSGLEDSTLKKMEKYTKDPNFTPKGVGNVSSSPQGLESRAMCRFCFKGHQSVQSFVHFFHQLFNTWGPQSVLALRKAGLQITLPRCHSTTGGAFFHMWAPPPAKR